jgi:ubiquinone/menaquinone biosynthesis C-methylase UbiE
MMLHEPSALEVILTLAAGTLGAGAYRGYAKRMGLQGNECVLELGCGSGNVSRHIAPSLDRGGRLTCLDISQRWLGVSRRRLRRYSNVDYRLGDVAKLDIPVASYDVALIHFVLHDIPRGERHPTLGHLVHVLKPGGRLFIREPFRDLTEQEIRRLARQNGLKELSVKIGELKTQGTVFEGVYCK